MALPTNTNTTFATVGIREDLIEAVFNVTPYETPLIAAMPRVKATQTKHEWLTDTLAAPSASNAQLEGDDATADSVTAGVRLANYTQISRKVAQVSGTDQVVKSVKGIGKLDYELMKKAKELKTDMESALFANQAYNAGNASTARVLAGIPTWLTSNTEFNSGGTPAGANPTGNGSNTRTDSGTTVPLTEAQVKTVLADSFTNSGKFPSLAFMSAPHKQQFSAFTGNVTRFVDVSSDKAALETAYEVYVSDFGRVKLIPSRLVRAHDIIFINPQYIALAYLRAFERVPLSKTGDSDRAALYAEYTLEMRNQDAHAAIYDAT